MTVLLVEDDHRISKFLLKGLAENSYRVTLAETGEEAREILNSHDFDGCNASRYRWHPAYRNDKI